MTSPAGRRFSIVCSSSVPKRAFDASGGYERGLRKALITAGFSVRRLNPLRVRLHTASL
jgi:hypothetical protein